MDIFGVGIGCGLIIGLLPVSEKQGLQLRKKISREKGDRELLHSAPTGIDAMIRRRPQSYEFHVSGSQPISALRVRSYDNPDMREGAPYTSYENMNGRALLEESSAAKLRYKGGINIIFSYLGNLR